MAASSSEQQHVRVRVDKNTMDTVFMSNRIRDGDMMTSEHLDKESHMLNIVAPFMRLYKKGAVHFESPYLLRILAMHKRKKFVSMVAQGQRRERMQSSTVSVLDEGNVDDFWLKYRNSDLVVASRFRSTRNVAFKTLDAIVIPHIMSRELDDDGAISDNRGAEEPSHIVLFVCYPKLRKIYVYDSLYDKGAPSRVKRLTEDEVRQKYHSLMAQRNRAASGFGGPPLWRNTMISASKLDDRADERYAMSVVIGYRWCEYGMRMAMHQIENFIQALEIVQMGVVEGRNSDKAAVARKSTMHGNYKPEPFRFVHAGYAGGRTQKSNDCGLWATLGMHDIARNWSNPSVPHSMSVDVRKQPEAFFARPSFDAIQYTAAIVVDMIRKYVLSWRYINTECKNIRVPTMSTLIISLPSVEPYADAINDFYNAACANVFPEIADATRSTIERVDASQLTSQRAVDVLVWVVDARGHSWSERDVYESIMRTLPSVRFVFIVHPGQSVGMYFRRPVDDRRYTRTPGSTLVYSLPPDADQLHRQDEHTAVASSIFVFSPNRESRKDSLVVELPTPSTRYLQWMTGVGWLCHS